MPPTGTIIIKHSDHIEPEQTYRYYCLKTPAKSSLGWHDYQGNTYFTNRFPLLKESDR